MIDLDLNLIKIFYAVAKENSITKAANMLYISQPAVSQSIKKLEQELGGVLFYRSNKGINLTEEGKAFFEYVKTSIELLEKAQDNFINFRNLESGVVNIGISTILTKIVLVDVLKKFCFDYPKIKINIVNDASPKLIDGLSHGVFDFVIINKSDSLNTYNETHLCDLPLCLVYNSQFFSFDELNIKEIGDLPLILQNNYSHTRKMFNDFALKHDIQINPKYEVASQELVKFMALEGLGVGLVFDGDMPKELKKVKTDKELPYNQIVLLENSNSLQSFASTQFKVYLLSKIKKT